MRYGVPYQGNKSPIADWLAEQIPSAENFYDMFAGGFAVTHRMVLERRHRRFFANDINALSCRLFSDCVNGRAPKARWVSHEDFDRLKTTDGYAACCFSFGSDWQSYIYSSVLEPLKRALHHAIVDLDFTETDALGIDLHYIAERPTIHARMLAVRKVVKNRGGELQHLERLQNLERLESFERLQNLTRLNTLDRLDSLAITTGDYRDVRIEQNSIIYCDPPYNGTHGYGCRSFDHQAFYDWCRQQNELVLVSEYQMPDDFETVSSKDRMDSKGANTRIVAKERLFIRKDQREMYYDLNPTLF